jgi:Tol biopolymer transport system component
MPVFIAISTICAILLSSSFVLQINQGAWAGTFPGENGQIAFTRQTDTTTGPEGDIYVMNADGSEQTRLTNNNASNWEPSWSPDGTKIAFTSTADGNPKIYVMNADGSNVTKLTSGTEEDGFNPSWSPDGTKIAFASFRDGNWEIYVMNAADGSGVKRLTNSAPDRDDYPSWSPDGTKIAFTIDKGNDGSPQIYVMNADGSNPTRLTNSARSDSSPIWSPDGTKIAFWSDREDGNFDVYVMNADGSGVKRLTDDPDKDWDPTWSPDGTKIAFVTDRESFLEGGEIYVMNAEDGSEQTNISNNPANDIHPDWGSTGAPPPPPPEEDTTPPVITIPENIVVEATSAEGAEVTYTVTAQDNVDGNATLEEDGTTITQDDIGGDIDVSCEPASGSTFPVGETTVDCTATDEAGNTETASFTVTVNPPSPSPPTTPREVIDELISTIQNLDNVPQDVKTSLIAVLNEVLNILNDNNPNNDESVCRTLDGFINQVNANETSDTLTADEADELGTQGEDIRNALDC